MRDELFANSLVAGLNGAPIPKRFGLAVSGGGDSMALLHLAAIWGRAAGIGLTAFTVDHGLRPEAAKEAQFVARQARRAGIGHQTLQLDWPGGAPESNIQAKARTARYEALAKAAQAGRIDHLMTAHTEDDQAETFLLRLARGSGLDGLSAMAPVTTLYGLIVHRPLLARGREELREILTAAGHSWVEDPSNSDRQFARVRMRALLPILAAEGLTVKRLARTAGQLRQARQALEQVTDQLLERHGHIAPQGFVTLGRAGLRGAPREVGLRVLARLLLTVNPRPYRPRAGRLEALYECAVDPDQCGRRTLGGCLVKAGPETIEVFRELRVSPAPVAVESGQKLVWDDRFDLTLGAGIATGSQIRALGTEGLRNLRKAAQEQGHTPPREAWYANLPCLWRGDHLLSVPFWPEGDMPAGSGRDMLRARFRQTRLGFMR